MAETAYKLKADASFPQVVREVETDLGVRVDTVGRNYAAGHFVLASEMTPRDRERAESGDLDHLLEEASVEEAEAARRSQEGQYGVFIPEHEAEAVILDEYGHETVPRDQVLELKSAGAEAAQDTLQAAKEEGRDERPNLTAPEIPSLREAEQEGKSVVPESADEDRVPDEELRGVEQPPGHPVGQDKAEAEGEEPEERKPRSRPRRSATKQEKEEGSGTSGSGANE